MIALAQISEAAVVGGERALSLLAEREPSEVPDCTQWKIASAALGVLVIFLVATVAWLLLRRTRLEIRLVTTIALVYLSGPSMILVVRSLGVEFSVPGVGWPGVIVALAAIGVIGFLGWHHQARGSIRSTCGAY